MLIFIIKSGNSSSSKYPHDSEAIVRHLYQTNLGSLLKVTARNKKNKKWKTSMSFLTGLFYKIWFHLCDLVESSELSPDCLQKQAQRVVREEGDRSGVRSGSLRKICIETHSLLPPALPAEGSQALLRGCAGQWGSFITLVLVPSGRNPV